MDDTRILSEIAAEFAAEENVTIGNWFGKPCLKVGGKVFAALWHGDMAFKLTTEAHCEALEIEGAHLFDPRGKGQPMKEWVQIPRSQSSAWSRFAKLASKCVAGAAGAQKEETIAGLVEARRKLLEVVSRLPPANQDEVFLGVWGVKDLLAHLVGWDYTNLEAVKAILADQRPGFWEHYDRDWATYNARLIAEYRRNDFAELVALVRESHRELVAFLETIPAEEYIKRGKIVTLLRAESKDENVHREQVEEFANHRTA